MTAPRRTRFSLSNQEKFDDAQGILRAVLVFKYMGKRFNKEDLSNRILVIRNSCKKEQILLYGLANRAG